MLGSLLVAILGVSASADPAAQSLESRLSQLQAQQDALQGELASSKRSVHSFLGERILLGGFFENGVTGLWGSSTKSQLTANVHVFGLNLAAEPADDWKFNAQVLSAVTITTLNPNGDPRLAALSLPQSREFGPPNLLTLVPQGYLEYASSRALIVQAGLGYVPFGIAHQLFEPILFRRLNGPQLLGGSGGDGVALLSSIWTGAHVHGSFRLRDNEVGYHLYTATPGSNTKTLGGGGRIWFATSALLTLGMSTQAAKRGGDTYQALGGDAALRVDRFGVDAEALVNMSSEKDPWSAYIEPFYTFFDGKLLVYATADILSNPLNSVATGPLILADPIKVWLYGGGINWLPLTSTRIRLGYLLHDYVGDNAEPSGKDRDFQSVDVSAGLAF